MNRKPIIAVTGDYDPSTGRYFLKQEYMNAIWLNGGIPVIIEPKLTVPEEWTGEREEWIRRIVIDESLFDAIDGVLFTGGNDVDPMFYGGTASSVNGTVIPERDAFEVKLARECVSRNIPSLGLCRGHQLMAAALGVPMTQDILTEEGSKVQHQQKAPTWYPTHRVVIEEGSKLYEIYGKIAYVNSFHHQAVKKGQEAYPFTITAYSEEDGIIEGFEKKELRYFVGVQWHPERMMQDPLQRALFQSFIEAAADGK